MVATDVASRGIGMVAKDPFPPPLPPCPVEPSWLTTSLPRIDVV